jgi:hypothetical protein
MLAPWDCVEAIAPVLAPGGVVVAYVATTTQMSRLVETLREHGGFTEPILVDRETGKYLGTLSTNKYDPDSTSNPHGRYGSKYSPDSINNPYSNYGSRYSNDSPNNPYATNAPIVIGD